MQTAVDQFKALEAIKDEAHQIRRLSGVYLDLIHKSADVCETTLNVMRLAQDFQKNPEPTLSWLGDLDPETRQKTFKIFALWKTLSPLIETYGCLDVLPEGKRDSNLLNAPIDELLQYVVEKTLREGQIKVVKPQIISEVYIVPTFDNAPPPPTGKSSIQTRPGNLTMAPAIQAPSIDEGRQFKIRTEVLYGLVATVSSKILQAPYTQLALEKLWTANGHTFFKANWWADKSARYNFATAWTWSPFMELRDWMNPALVRLANRLDAAPGVYVSVLGGAMFSHTHAPAFLIEDLQSALTENHIRFEITSAPAPIQVIRQSTGDKEYGSRASCPDYVTFNRDFTKDFSVRIKALRALPSDFSSFDWTLAHPCSGGFDAYQPSERVVIQAGLVSSQRIANKNFTLEPGATPNQVRLTTYSLDQTVQQAIAESEANQSK